MPDEDASDSLPNFLKVICPLCGQKPRRLSLVLSPTSLPVLLRRLFEHDFGGDEEIEDAARSLGQSMLDCIRQSV